jgi:plasmid stabilization system protein ParE
VPRLKLRLSSRAARQIETASLWWRKHRDKAPTAFDDDIAEAFDLIRENSSIGRPVRISRRLARRLYLERVGYFLFYSEPHYDVIEIGALWHASRGSRPRP